MRDEERTRERGEARREKRDGGGRERRREGERTDKLRTCSKNSSSCFFAPATAICSRVKMIGSVTFTISSSTMCSTPYHINAKKNVYEKRKKRLSLAVSYVVPSFSCYYYYSSPLFPLPLSLLSVFFLSRSRSL